MFLGTILEDVPRIATREPWRRVSDPTERSISAIAMTFDYYLFVWLDGDQVLVLSDTKDFTPVLPSFVRKFYFE